MKFKKKKNKFLKTNNIQNKKLIYKKLKFRIKIKMKIKLKIQKIKKMIQNKYLNKKTNKFYKKKKIYLKKIKNLKIK